MQPDTQQHRTSTAGSHRTSLLETRLTQTVDAGLAALIFLAPLFMGGRHPVGRLVFVILVACTGVAWVARQAVRPSAAWVKSPALLLITAAMLLLVVQLLPLPESWIAWASPALPDNLPLWSSQTDPEIRMGIWNQLTLSPEDTRQSLAMLAGYGVLFLVVLQRIEQRSDCERLLRWIAWSAIGISILGLAQVWLGNGRFLWVYEHPSRDTTGVVKGPFANENHFAHFLALAVGPLLWWTWASVRRPAKQSTGFQQRHRADRRHYRTAAFIVALGIVALAGLLTLSRGGILVLMLATIASVFAFSYHGLLGRRAWLGLIAVLAIATGAVGLQGYRPLADQLARVGIGSLKELKVDGRGAVWRANVRGIADYGRSGTGAGTHLEVYSTYYDQPHDVQFTHSENGYLQVLLETGVAGLAILLVGIGLVIRWTMTSWWRASTQGFAACSAAVLASVLASLTHSAVDFVWYIPACMTLTLILAATACRLFHLTLPATAIAGVPLPRPVWLAGGMVVLLVSAGAVGTLWRPALAARHWDAYLKLAYAAADQPSTATGQRGVSDVLDPVPMETLDAMLVQLESVLRWHPKHARAHMRLAQMSLRRFEHRQRFAENAMILTQIREAALASNFPTTVALRQWLDRAIGDNAGNLYTAQQHARRALQLCPYLGEGYIYLAELDFLDGKPAEVKRAYVQQALRVRPYSGRILLAAGHEAALEGRQNLALRYWQSAFHRDPDTHLALFNLLARPLGARTFLTLMQPGPSELNKLLAYYRQAMLADDARHVATVLVDHMRQQAGEADAGQAASLWHQVCQLYDYLQDDPNAVRAARQVLKHDPHNLTLRVWLAGKLIANEQYDEAMTHLRWCQRRRPNDREIENLMLVARQRSTAPVQAAREETRSNIR